MTAPIKTKRLRKCNYCKDKFSPFNSFQKFCFKDECIKAHNSTERSKKQRKAVKEHKSSDKSIQLKLAQTIVNKYVRLRDQNKPCISCGHKEGRQFHAGHYESAGGNQQQRFYTLNIHKQCSICNNFKSGNLIPYRLFMIKKYGIEKVESIESDHSTKKYTVEYLHRMIRVFRKKIKLYEKRR